VVAAAGNEGEERIHAEVAVLSGGRDSVSIFLPPYSTGDAVNFFAVDAFYAKPESLQVTVVTPAGGRFGPYALGQMVEELTGEGTLFLVHRDRPGVDHQVQFDVSDFNPDSTSHGKVPPPAWGDWTVVFERLSAGPGWTEVDLWVAFSSMPAHCVLGYDPTEELSSPATASRVLAVGSYNTKRCWPDSTGTTQCSSVPDTLAGEGMLTFFSSKGPTRDGREKPEVVAPGFVVTSARSHQMDTYHRDAYQLGRTLDPDREHFVFAGTSMSAPHVAGALALLLQNVPHLTPEDARARLRSTAYQDSHTGPTWNPAAGSGKLDVAALIDTVVAAEVRELALREMPDGRLELTWIAGPTDPVAAFRLDRMRPGEPWTPMASFPGAGPHRWVDADPAPGTRYRLWAWDRRGERFLWTETASPVPPGTGLAVQSPRPNPFHRSTTVRFRLDVRPEPAPITATVIDALGRRVRGLIVAPGETPGERRVTWDGCDQRGQRVASGPYWIYIRAGKWTERIKVVRVP
jgi:hypothetical protein